MKGTKVGSYIIEDKIGEGGMGVVYSAKHDRMNRPAVVKMLRKQLAESPEMARRFENEATAAASIGHPGIVQVFDIGQHDDGSLYIVMELLRGESLQERLSRQGRLPIVQAIAIIRQAAGALAAAHKAGIVHRDLKPDNMFIVPDPEVEGGERVKLLDFGIAKLADDGPGAMQTKTGAMMGTPHFMSPEQCQGAGGVDHRSDLYALGCILFQLVTGRTPFQGSGVGDFIVAHMTTPPPSLRSMAPHAPQGLEDVVATLLAKNPEERFGSADALVNALSHIRVDQGAVLGAQAIASTQMAPASVMGRPPGVPSSMTERAAAPPQTTMGLSTGQTAATAPPGHVAYSASRVASAPQRGKSSSMRWSLLGVLGVLAIGGIAYGVVGRRSAEPPPKAASLVASDDAGSAETTPTPAPPKVDAASALPGVQSGAEQPVPKPSIRELSDEQRANKERDRKQRAKAQGAQEKRAKAESKRELAERKARAAKAKTENAAAELANSAANKAAAASDDIGRILGGKETSAKQTVEPPPKTSIKGISPEFQRKEEGSKMPAIKQSMRACGNHFDVREKNLVVTIVVGLSGRVKSAKVSPPGLGQLAACIRKAVFRHKFRPRLKPTAFRVMHRL